MNSTKNILIEVGRKVELHRKENKLTTHQLAKRCNIKLSQLQRIESGLEDTSLSVLINISNTLNFDINELFVQDYSSQHRVNKLISSVKKLENISDNDIDLTTHLIDLLLLKYSVKEISEQLHTYHQ